MIDINAVGTTYTIVDKKSGKSKELQIVFLETLLDAVGYYDSNDYSNFQDYIDETSEIFDSCANSIYDITWYAATEDETDFLDAVRQAYKEGNSLVVIETLPPT